MLLGKSKRMLCLTILALTIVPVSSYSAHKYKLKHNHKILSHKNAPYMYENELDKESNIPVTEIDKSLTPEYLQAFKSEGTVSTNTVPTGESNNERVSKTGDVIDDPAFSSKEEKPEYEEVYEQKNVNGETVLAPKFIKDEQNRKRDLNEIINTARCGQFYASQVVHIDFKVDKTNCDVPINANTNNPNGDNPEEIMKRQQKEEELLNYQPTENAQESTSVNIESNTPNSPTHGKAFSTHDGKGAIVRYSGKNGAYDLNGNRKSESFRKITKTVGLNTYADWYVDPTIFNSSDEEVLAHLIYSEAGDQPYEGMLAVGNVIMNRVKASGFNLRDIVFQRKQFFGTQTKWFKSKPNANSYRASREALAGVNVVPTSFKFADLRYCNPKWAHEYKFIRRIGNHWFFE